MLRKYLDLWLDQKLKNFDLDQIFAKRRSVRYVDVSMKREKEGL